MIRVALASETDWEGWRAAARALVLAGTEPDQVRWTIGGEGDPLPEASGTFSVNRSRVALAQQVIQARADGEKFALMHRLIAGADAVVEARARALALAVRAEAHRMRTELRFLLEDGRFIGYYEPRHFALEANARLMAQRFPELPCSIVTPDGSAHWDGGEPHFSPGASVDNDEALTLYWHRSGKKLLIEAGPGDGLPAAEALDENPRAPDVPPLGPVVLPREAPELEAEADEAAHCTRCPLSAPATQTVFGEGPAGASLMFVGEQPGDQEDVIGRPFVGPAGQLLDRALEEAGIDRRTAYITNAVKHFKFVPRGKRRLHQKPDTAEVLACSIWLSRETAVLQPKLTVLLGATAAQAVLGRLVTIGRERGRRIAAPDGRPVFVTVHPSFLLRLPDEESKAREYRRFVEDLRAAASLAR